MYVRKYIHTCFRITISFERVHTHAHAHTYTHVHTHTHTHMHISFVYTYTYVHIHINPQQRYRLARALTRCSMSCAASMSQSLSRSSSRPSISSRCDNSALRLSSSLYSLIWSPPALPWHSSASCASASISSCRSKVEHSRHEHISTADIETETVCGSVYYTYNVPVNI